MRPIRVLIVVLAAALSTLAGAEPAVAQFTIGGDPRVDPDDFRITTFASGLNYPNGLARLSDGSILVATSNPNGSGTYFNSSGALLRFTDTNGDGIADGPGQVMYSDLMGVWVALKVAGPLVFITSARQGVERITILRMNNGPAVPYALVGTLNFTFPANWQHKTYGLAARPTPGGPAGTYELYFNVGSSSNSGETTGVVGLSGLLQGTLQAESIYRVRVTDTGTSATVSNLTLIAKGLRNAAGMDFHPATGDLYFEDNGIDGLVDPTAALSADEINRIARGDLGRIVPDFGFPDDYIDYATGQRVGSGGVQPLATFRPLPCASCPGGVAQSEGPSGIVFAPPQFPSYVNNGVFIGFHGKFGAPPASNEENALVFWDLGTNKYFHFIESFQLGHGDQLLSTQDSLFIADMASNGSLNTNGGNGVVYQIKRRTTGPSLVASFTSPNEGATVSGTVTVGMAASGSTASPYTFTLRLDGAGAPLFATTVAATTAAFSWNTSGVAPGAHQLQLTVQDANGNVANATRTVVVQPGAISVFITHPATDGVTVGGTAWFTIWLENAAAGTRNLTLSVDGVPVGTASSTSNGPISMAWNTAGASAGTHTATVSVRDSAGKSGSASRTVAISGISVFITHPETDGTTIGGTLWFTIWLENAAAGTRNLTLSIDGVAVATAASTSNGPISMAWDSAGASGGQHRATVSVRDAAGRSGTATRTFLVPSIAGFFTQLKTDGTTVGGTAWFTIWLDNSAAGVRNLTLSIDGVAVATAASTSNGPISVAWDTSGASGGPHAARVGVRDAAGSSGSADRTVVIAGVNAVSRGPTTSRGR